MILLLILLLLTSSFRFDVGFLIAAVTFESYILYLFLPMTIVRVLGMQSPSWAESKVFCSFVEVGERILAYHSMMRDASVSVANDIGPHLASLAVATREV